ncbi:VPLPA-CTERM sorting domain-containing protein [Methylicorpusculum oleiharenae]|uniref:VPLPA-CTERM sorting domain-containing protein n=1 Tax=Methylicorpusculum oleiharenae TaxID=1338687 RepID=UPI00135B2E7B|nr:VPLPA-CTERM sorting domain-containing protein [Methylicorpusculum oleiharenae]MCD2452529.1 VPLPA-CTERM sorting domain-containing protein [Methylicorpusculum oleiharenae]
MYQTKKQKLRKAVIAALGLSVMAGFSTQASAYNSFSLGTYTGTDISLNHTTPFKAFSDYEAQNQGWVHTARFLTLTVGSAQDITDGKTYDVQLQMTGRGNLGVSGSVAIDNPSFAIWTAGANSIDTGSVVGIGHAWNPTRGPNEVALDSTGNPATVLTNEVIRAAGVLDGHDGWIGYVNSGPAYTLINSTEPLAGGNQTNTGNPVTDSVSNGALNTTSLSWLTNPSASSTSFTNDYYRNGNAMAGVTSDYAMMLLYGLKAGNYLIATGGSCPTNVTPAAVCGTGQQFTFDVSAAPAMVPVPAAVWFFGTALLGLVGLGRRKSA